MSYYERIKRLEKRLKARESEWKPTVLLVTENGRSADVMIVSWDGRKGSLTENLENNARHFRTTRIRDKRKLGEFIDVYCRDCGIDRGDVCVIVDDIAEGD